MVRHQHCIYHRLLLWLALNVRITSPNQLYYAARSPQEKPRSCHTVLHLWLAEVREQKQAKAERGLKERYPLIPLEAIKGNVDVDMSMLVDDDGASRL